MLRAFLATVAIGCGASPAGPVKETAGAGVDPAVQARISNGDRWTDLVVIGDRRRAHTACERLVADELVRQAPTARMERACAVTILPPRDREVMLVEQSDGRGFVSAFDYRVPPDLRASREETLPFGTIVQCARALRELTDAEQSLLQASKERQFGALGRELTDASRDRERRCATADEHDCDRATEAMAVLQSKLDNAAWEAEREAGPFVTRVCRTH